MPRRAEIVVFSTSFIDLICIALCAQIVQWVTKEIELESVEPQPVFVEVTQIGIDHLEGWSLSDAEGRALASGGKGAMPRQEVPIRNGVAAIERSADATFAGRLTLTCDHLESALKLSLNFSRCSMNDSLHPIQVNAFGRAGLQQQHLLRHMCYASPASGRTDSFSRSQASNWGGKTTAEEFVQDAHLLEVRDQDSNVDLNIGPNGDVQLESRQFLEGSELASAREAILRAVTPPPP